MCWMKVEYKQSNFVNYLYIYLAVFLGRAVPIVKFYILFHFEKELGQYITSQNNFTKNIGWKN